MNIVRLALAILVLLVLTGCASLSRNECVNANWTTIGFGDGSRGLPVGQIDRHRRACADHGVTPDLDRYGQGHAQGVRSYCTVTRGVEAGQAGRAYIGGLCPVDLEPAFLRGHAHGWRIHESLGELERIRQGRKTAQQDFAHASDSIKATEAKLIAGGGTPQDRAKLVNALRALNVERDDAWARIQSSDAAEGQQQQYLAALRSQAQTIR